MGKRAIELSYELWKEMLTEGWKTEHIECTRGLPKSAEFVMSFVRNDSVLRGNSKVVPNLILVFEDDSWKDGNGYKVSLPTGESILVMDCVYRQHHDD